MDAWRWCDGLRLAFARNCEFAVHENWFFILFIISSSTHHPCILPSNVICSFFERKIAFSSRSYCSFTHTHYFLPSGKMSISVASVRSLLQIVFHWGVSHLLVWRRLRTAAETIDITPFQTDLRILHIHPYPDITNWFSLSRRPIGRVKSVLEHDIPSTCCHWPTTHILWTSGQLDPVNRVADGTG